MTTNIQFIKIQTSETLRDKTLEEVNKLRNRFDWVETVSVSFKEGSGTSDKEKICKIEINTPTPRLFVSVVDFSYESALKIALSDIGRQLKKRKEILKAK